MFLQRDLVGARPGVNWMAWAVLWRSLADLGLRHQCLRLRGFCTGHHRRLPALEAREGVGRSHLARLPQQLCSAVATNLKPWPAHLPVPPCPAREERRGAHGRWVHQLAESDRRLGILEPEIPYPDGVWTRSQQQPTADGLRLPELWLAAGQCFCRAQHVSPAIKAAAVCDQGLATLAQHRPQQIGASC